MSTHKNNQATQPQLQDCIDHLAQWRITSPSRHRLLLDDLRRDLPQAYGQMQAHPPFRHLQESPLGPRAACGTRGVGGFTGSIDHWLSTAVKDMLTQQSPPTRAPRGPSEFGPCNAAIRADATMQLMGIRHFTALSLTRA